MAAKIVQFVELNLILIMLFLPILWEEMIHHLHKIINNKTIHCFIDQLDSISQKFDQFSSSEHADLTKPGKIKLSGPENSNFRRKKDKNQKFDSIPVIFFHRSVFFKNSSIFCSGLKLLNGAKNYLVQIHLMSF